MAEDPWAKVRDEIEADVRRLVERLRHLSPARFDQPPEPPRPGAPPYTSRAEATRAAASTMASTAAALEAASAGVPTREGDLPRLPAHALADQVAVTGNDLLAALDLVTPGATAQQWVADSAAVLADVRRRI